MSVAALLQNKIFGCRNNDVKWTRRFQSDNMCIKPLITRVYCRTFSKDDINVVSSNGRICTLVCQNNVLFIFKFYSLI